MIKIAIFCVLLVVRQVLVASPPGDVVGKLSIGYQGWFTCAGDLIYISIFYYMQQILASFVSFIFPISLFAGDNSPVNDWYHWAGFVSPSPGHQSFEIWPDVREYTKTYRTGYANLRNGQPPNLFSSYDDQTIQVHFNWLQKYGIEVVSLQRFGANFGDRRVLPYVNGLTKKVMTNAIRTNRKFYIQWDISGWTNFNTELKNDWINYVQDFTKSPAYARQNGKPVVCVWGLGFTDRPGTVAQSLDIINYLKTNGLYVIGGVPKYWITGLNVKSGFLPVFDAVNMISPWTVGSYNTIAGASAFQMDLSRDLTYCNSHNIDYQPVVWPGFAWSNWMGGSRNVIPRLHGDFMWRQFVNFRQLGIKTTFVAMFDEYDEGTAIAKAAETNATIPTNQYFLTLDADGVFVSSDFYLRLVNDGNRMMKGSIPLQLSHPTSHTLPSSG